MRRRCIISRQLISADVTSCLLVGRGGVSCQSIGPWRLQMTSMCMSMSELNKRGRKPREGSDASSHQLISFMCLLGYDARWISDISLCPPWTNFDDVSASTKSEFYTNPSPRQKAKRRQWCIISSTNIGCWHLAHWAMTVEIRYILIWPFCFNVWTFIPDINPRCLFVNTKYECKLYIVSVGDIDQRKWKDCSVVSDLQ